MTTAVQMPVVTGNATKSGRGIYRKMILPAGKTLTVKGTRLNLTPDLLAKVKRTFDDGWLDTVPFNLVDDANSHTADPERTRGTVRALDVTDDGLYATLDAPDELLEQHSGRLGVSPRLLFNESRADGRKADVVLAHVAGTNDPHVGGMGVWERIADLSSQSEAVVDLTAATYEGAPMALSDEQQAALAAFADRLNPDGTMKVADPEPVAVDDDAPGDITDEDLQALLGQLGDDEQPETDQAPEPAAASLSADVNLAAQQEQLSSELQQVQMDLAAAKWEKARADYVKAGVPPFLLDAASKVFDPKTVDLSAGDVDPAGVVREMLDLAKGLIDVDSERGTTVSTSDDAEADARRQRAAAANAHFGIK